MEDCIMDMRPSISPDLIILSLEALRELYTYTSSFGALVKRSSLNYAYICHQPVSKDLLKNSPTKHSTIYLRNAGKSVVYYTHNVPFMRCFF